jgi:hypothetical protein
MIDLYCPCDLHHDLVEKSILIGALTRDPSQIDKNADMPPHLVQRRRLLFMCFQNHVSAIRGPNGSGDNLSCPARKTIILVDRSGLSD